MMRRRWRWRDDDGNMAIEFAMLAPVMITLIMGVADWSIAAREISELRAAARAGLQAVLSDSDDLEGATAAATIMAPDAVVSTAQSCQCSNGNAIECDESCPSGTTLRRWVTVSVTDTVPLIFPWPGVADPYPISGTAKARVQ